jgi:hypothetical protein
LELRAVTNLSRVALQQHQRAEARQVLEATARWFTEGEDLVDLQAARALLAEVS